VRIEPTEPPSSEGGSRRPYAARSGGGEPALSRKARKFKNKKA
jgi:hypothetical protein